MNLDQKSNNEKRIADVDRKRVLVIDDDLPLRGMLAAALRQHGFQADMKIGVRNCFNHSRYPGTGFSLIHFHGCRSK